MFQRQPLRDQIQTEILARIADGRLAPGQRINETHLAEDLGLSRTPLREAMLTLRAAGFLDSTLGRGFQVPALAATEFRQVQDMLALLEPHALIDRGPLDPTTVMELNNLLNRAKMRLVATAKPKARAAAFADLVFQWSGLTVGDAPNTLLAGEVQRLQGLSRRYWFVVCRQELAVEAILESYGRIYEALRTGQTAQARDLTAAHMKGMAQAALTLLTAQSPD